MSSQRSRARRPRHSNESEGGLSSGGASGGITMNAEDPTITRRGAMAGAAATAVLAAARANAQSAGGNDDLTRLSVAEAGRRIAARELSPVDLTRAYLDRIERVDPRINSYITVT